MLKKGRTMARVPLQSSVLAAVEYFPEPSALDIVFITGEAIAM